MDLKKEYISLIFSSLSILIFIIFSQITRLKFLFFNNTLMLVFILLIIFVVANLTLHKMNKKNLVDNEKYYYLFDYASFFTTSLSIMFLITSIIISPAVVSGNSMEPNLHNNDIAFVSPLLYDIDRFDIVIVSIEDNNVETLIVKRVIGLPGEEIRYENGKLYIDGVYYEESFDTSSYTDDFSSCDLEVCRIPEGSYFLLGDNRNNSTDSRYLGYINRSSIVGKLLFTI